MRASRPFFGIFSAAILCVFSFPAAADFQVSGTAPTSTLPAFRSQAGYSASGAENASNPANYYAAANAEPVNIQPSYAQPQPFTQPSYAMAPLAASHNGADPGVGPVVIEGKAPAPVIIEGQQPVYQQVGYGYGAATYDTTATPAPAPAGYGSMGTGAGQSAMISPNQPANVPYGNAPGTLATQGSYGSYGTQNYGAQVGAQSGYGANNYGMSGYAPSYGTQGGAPGYAPQPQYQQPQAQAGYGASYGSGYGATAQGYGAQPQQQQAYAGSAYGYGAPQPQSTYSASAYGSGGAPPVTGTEVAPYGQTQPYATQPAGMGGVSSSSAYGASSYGAPGYAPQGYTATTQQAYGGQAYTTQMQGGYGAQQAYPAAPAPQGYGAYGGDYGAGYGASAQPQSAYGYAPQPYQQQYQPQPDYGAPQYQPQGYTPISAPNSGTSPRRSALYHDAPVSLAAVPARGGFYAALRSGVTNPSNTKFTDLNGPFSTGYKTGWELGAALGYGFPSVAGWFSPRAELEVNNHFASVKDHEIGNLKFEDPNAFGNTNTLRVFANGYLDFDTPWRRIVTPYIGGGFGVGLVDYDRHGTSVALEISDSDMGLAYNFGGGLSFPMFLRGMALDVGYRYSQVLDIELTALDGTKSKTDVSAHELTVGLRQKF